jgi:maleate isomerase
MIQALTALNVKRLVIAAPWSEATNVTTAAFIEACGFSVLAHQALGHISNLEIGLLGEQTAFDMGVAVDQPQAQAVMLACGNWLTLGIVDRLESAIGKPVLTTNQVSLWAALILAGYHGPVFGWGRLLREYNA